MKIPSLIATSSIKLIVHHLIVVQLKSDAMISSTIDITLCPSPQGGGWETQQPKGLDAVPQHLQNFMSLTSLLRGNYHIHRPGAMCRNASSVRLVSQRQPSRRFNSAKGIQLHSARDDIHDICTAKSMSYRAISRLLIDWKTICYTQPLSQHSLLPGGQSGSLH